MKKHLSKRLLSWILVLAMVMGTVPAVSAAPAVRWNETDAELSLDMTDRIVENEAETAGYNPTDTVRVSIVLEDRSVIQAGYSTANIASNREAMAYSRDLKTAQEAMARTISTQVLRGRELDVVWNLTLVGNIISANVPYGKIEAIEALDGVEKVVIERTYEPCVVSKEQTTQPQMYTSSDMTGSNMLWQTGYTGAGTRIAIIDTGTDTDHQSFDNGAFVYSLERNAAEAGMSYEEYVESLDLLDVEEIAAVLPDLNLSEAVKGLTAEELYNGEKQAFSYNYKDLDFDVTHDNDYQSEHGSHVAGISTANRYIPSGDGYVDALSSVFVAGVAPDAQLVTMKVFGKGGGPADSDYMSAIEDAILLGCDSVNLSLGTSVAGFSNDSTYDELLQSLAETDTVVVASAANSGNWAETTMYGYLYSDDVNFDTVGSPGSYTNMLTVASVENDGTVGYSFQVGDTAVVYSEGQGDYNRPFTSLDKSADMTGTVYEYVFIDGLGYPADYEGMDLTGKVVFCSRGVSSFYEKANAAVNLGAAAVVIYNNTAGTINMSLAGYYMPNPVVSILQADAAKIRALSTEQTTEGGLTYFTGEMTVSGRMTAASYGSEYYLMSSFSSWGVPGSLELKPEITAPGGMIYSVYGSTPDGGGSDQYELMSGTSMAAPQITGMAALVAQYLNETGLAESQGLKVRTLAQSLLMSTAKPLREEVSGGNYYSLLDQGAGLARVDLAAAADSYILVDGQPDGKVKAELGDDPERTGVYEFSFEIHNMSDEAQSYALSADVFRQDVFDLGELAYGSPFGYYQLDTWTADLPANAEFTTDGELTTAVTADLSGWDMNGDGTTDALDADWLLEYLLGNETELHADGDVSGDGLVNTYDAHVLLALLEGSTCVNVPAEGTVTVSVKLTLTAEGKALLDECYGNGTYVEAFVYAEEITAEGEGTSHSIPVLAFYGSWSDPTMFDHCQYVELLNNTVVKYAPYLYAVVGNGNYVTIDYGDGSEYYYGGNPVLADDTYLPERNAFNNQDGSRLVSQSFSLIRNAGGAKLTITDVNSGQVYMERDLGELYSAYYYVNGSSWENTIQTVLLDWAGTDANGKPLPEGTTVELTVTAAPEYYVDENGNVDYDALGKGAELTTPLTIDNTAPEASSISLDLLRDNVLNVTARDNRHVAAVALLNASGSLVMASASPNQTEAGAEVQVELDISGITGKSFLVAVFDYANNYTVYEIQLGLESPERPYFTVVDYENSRYMGIDADGTEVVLATGDRGMIQTAEYVDGYVFEVSNGDSLYVAQDDDLSNFRYICELDPENEYGIFTFMDLTYNVADGKLYGLFYADLNGQMYPYLCTVDMFTGQMDVLCEMPVDFNNMTIDGEGNFYSITYGWPSMYRYTLNAVVNNDWSELTYVGEVGYYGTQMFNALAWDHNTDKLYWAYPNTLLEINPETAEPTLLSYFMYGMTGLYIRPDDGGSMFDPTDEVSGISIDYTEVRTLVGDNVLLTANVWPWNLTDASVTWTSDNESVATVDETGMVNGLTEGSAVITATSNLDPNYSVSCTVNVIALDKTMNAIVWDEEGDIWWSEFNVNNPAGYTKLTEEPCNVALASTALMPDGTLYAASVDTSSGSLRSSFFTVDPETFEPTKIGDSTDGYSDIAPAPNLRGGTAAASYGGNFLVIDKSNGDYYAGSGDIFYMFGYNLVGIAYAGSQVYQEEFWDTVIDWYFLIDTEGYVYLMGWMEQGGYLYYLEHPATNQGIFTVIQATSDTPYFSSLYYDGDFLYYSCFNEGKNVSTLYAIDTTGTRKAFNLGNFGDGVWPAGGLVELDGDGSVDPLMNMEITAEPKPVENAEPMGKVEAKAKTSASGSLNTVSTLSEGQLDKNAGKVTVKVTAAEAAANGRITVNYNTADLTLESVNGTTAAFAYTTAEGTVELAYAAAEALSADETVAMLTFTVNESAAEETTVTITESERNDAPAADSEELVLTVKHLCPSARFTDVDTGRWYHEYVDYVVENGLMNGMTDTAFGPNTDLSRGMLVTVLYRLAGSPEVDTDSAFTDLKAGSYYEKAVCWAAANGIAKGVTATTFQPDSVVSREQAATFLMRYVQAMGGDTSAAADLSGFADGGDVSNFAKAAMSWAVAEGFFEGYTDGTLQPAATLTRAQMAKLLTILAENF